MHYYDIFTKEYGSQHDFAFQQSVRLFSMMEPDWNI